MNRDRSKRRPKSAAELMAELNANPQYIAREQQRRRQQADNVEMYRQAAEPVLRDLAAAGFEVQTVGELKQMGTEYPTAVPILLSWLPKIGYLPLKEDIVRTLSVPWSSSQSVPVLIAEFQREGSENQNEFRWAIANGLSITADNAAFEPLAALVTNKKYGRSRQMLAVALGNCSDSRAVDVLIELLSDEEVVGHAVVALGMLRSKLARPHILKLEKHPKAWIRAEVRKALARIDRGASSVR